MNQKSKLAKRRSGLTLVEMMISVALTLMVVFAVVRVFETLGDSVTDGRATIEQSGNLRTAAQLLQDDFDGVTVTSLPPRSPEQGEGYFEPLDGPGTDSQYPFFNQSTQLPALARLANSAMVDVGDTDGFLEGDEYDTCVGDVDDILTFTSYRPDNPFTGTICHPRIQLVGGGKIINQPSAPTANLESNYAEVIWWLQVERLPNDVGLNQLSNNVVLFPNSGGGDVNVNAQRQIWWATGYLDKDGNELEKAEMRWNNALRYPNVGVTTLGTPVRSLRRRVMLIRPDLDLSKIKLQGTAEVDAFLSNNDISVRVIREGETNIYRVEANSLADLAERENRSFRQTWQNSNRALTATLQTARLLPTRTLGLMLDFNSMIMRQASMKDMVLKYEPTWYNSAATESFPVIMLRKGKDVVISDVTAFDFQIWDPKAITRMTEGTMTTPSDPGYLAGANVLIPTTGEPTGAFVDLGFAVPPKAVSALPVALRGQFGGFPHMNSFLELKGIPGGLFNGQGAASYDTWSSSYEHDGVNQDGDVFGGVPLVDEGRDGIDNDGFFGIDDPGENETSPPYPYPLVGLKVSIRTMDFGTRQVRQTSVTKDFLPE